MIGRPPIPPEQVLKALLLRVLFSIRSERPLVHQLIGNLLFRWFVDLPVDAPAWDATSFTKNRERLEPHGLVRAFLDGEVEKPGTGGSCGVA
jgi:transposase